MTSGITWIRKKQRELARAALALFALAWLQAAIVPCTMAYAVDVAGPAALQSHAGAHGDHHESHDGHAGDDAPGTQTAHCPYCPPAQDRPGVDCDHDAECAFPHDPQIDARTLIAFYGPPPCQVLDVGSRVDAPALRIFASDAPADAARRPLAIRYCRFIE